MAVFINWLKSLFFNFLNLFSSSDSKDYSTDIEVDDIEEDSSEDSKTEEDEVVEELDPVKSKAAKIAIIVGHTAKSPGAYNYKGESEFSFNSRIAEKVKNIMKEKYPSKKVRVFFREEGYYSTAVTRVGQNVGKFGAKISLELHFNSFHQVAYGCEVLIWEGAEHFLKTVKVADILTDNLADKFDLRQRHRHNFPGYSVGDGVKILASRDRGALNIKACNDNGVKHAMLIEPCFANKRTKESEAIFENEDKYAEFLADELASIDIKS